MNPTQPQAITAEEIRQIVREEIERTLSIKPTEEQANTLIVSCRYGTYKVPSQRQ